MAVGSAAGRRSLRALTSASVLTLLVLGAPGAACAQWRPPGIGPSTATLAGVLAIHDKAVGPTPPGYDNRRETWTYTNGTHRLPVAVAVRGENFRVDVTLDGATYTAGRWNHARWRGDANGIVHGTQADLQSDAIDRFPDVLFGFRPQDCELAGETAPPDAAWVVADRPEGDRVHWLFIDQSSGLLVKSILREGQVVETTTFDRFEPSSGTLRAQHWHVTDGNRTDDIDADLDGVVTGGVSDAAIIFPPSSDRRTFAAPPPAGERVQLPAQFFRDGRIDVTVDLDGSRYVFDLDTGTASISLEAAVARRLAGGVVLEHATVGKMRVGALQAENVSTLAIPIFGGSLQGILGYDFFFGHVVHIDYWHERVEVLSGRAAEAVFEDPSLTVLAAKVDQGLPLVHAEIGAAAGDDFALDTGSPRFYVMQPFAQTYAGEIAAHWMRVSQGTRPIEYLEGTIEVVPYRAADLLFGRIRFRNVDVGVEVPSRLGTAIAIPFDGIIGTDILRNFDLWFDFDHGRVGMRYTGR
jgi:hypothetical protein